MTIRVGIIGAGHMGQVFAEQIAYRITEADLVTIADVSAEQVQAVAKRLGVAKNYAHPNELSAQTDIDAVVIVTPTGTHIEMAKAAASAGKHFFCEKPLALTVAGCDEALTAVKQDGVKLQAGFMRRFDSAYHAAKKQID